MTPRPLLRLGRLAALGALGLLGLTAVVRDAVAGGPVAMGQQAAPNPGPFLVRAGSELAFYQDTDSTTVWSPVLFGSAENVLGGYGITGSFAVDVVSTASADIVATASTRWKEVRYAPALSGHRRFGDADVTVRAALSREPDYLSIAAGASVSLDLARKLVTPSVSYDFIHDTVGLAETPFSVFSRPVVRHNVGLSVALVLSKATVFIPSLTAVFESGDDSKPYRFIPIFDPATARRVQPGMSAADLDRLRLDVKPREQLPTERQRWALDGLILHRFSSSTVRLDQRLYVDTWGLKASTTDARYFLDVSDDVRLGAHLRFHAQTGVNFWTIAYVARPTPLGLALPALRTGDRELGPLFTPTGGLDVRFPLGKHSAFALTFAGEVAYTRFVDALFITQRTSFLGSSTLEAEL